MDDRAALKPVLPLADATTSYWQRHPSPIASLRTTAGLPRSADIVIVGSGISGACIAYYALAKWPSEKVVMLEARTACSGATGRNGGHTKAASYRSFPHNARKYGIDEAVKIARLEYDNIRAMHAFAATHNLQCDSHPCDSVDIFFDQTALDAAREAVRMIQEAMEVNDPAARYTFHDGDETRARFLVPGALGAVTYEAGSLSAYRFVTGVLKLALEKGLNLQTNTPATSIVPASSDGQTQYPWLVTPRGSIKARKLVLATNGYSARLWPPLQGVIVPLRGQVTVQRAGDAMPQDGLATTYSFIHPSGYDYMISRPPDADDAGDIVIGGGLKRAKQQGLYEYGDCDDTTLNPVISEYLGDCLPRFFGPNWGNDSKTGRVRDEWTGIMGYSADGLPLVGELPGQRGIFISASFQGSGMVLCLLCAQALINVLSGRQPEWDDWFPEAFRMSTARLEKRFQGDLKAFGRSEPAVADPSLE